MVITMNGKELDLKWVLLALYSEYCKDNGDFDNVHADMIEAGSFA